VVDDSETARSALATALTRAGGIDVVGMASDGVQACELARTVRPDVMTIDIQMPRMDGMETIAHIMEQSPCPLLVVCAVSPGSQREVDLSFRAMALGALDLIAKPSDGESLWAWGARAAERVRLMAEVPVVTRRRSDRPPRPLALNPQGRIDIIALVASTGGPPALAVVLGSLPKGLRVPVVIAQHMAAGFNEGLARWLGSVGPLKVELARQGVPSEPGVVYVAPDNQHLEVAPDGRVRLVPALDGGHCPSGDRLLTSLAAAYGSRVGAAVLSGMGTDGAEGLLAVRNAGGVTVAQDEASSTVYGMPQAAVKVGAASYVLSIELIGSALRGFAERRHP
jgi:two-component system chemotaxis response regulator CheB